MSFDCSQLVKDHYGLKASSYVPIRMNKRTVLYRVDTPEGKYILKSFYVHEPRLQFILEAERYLRKKGIKIPAVIPTTNKRLYIQLNGRFFVLQQYINAQPYKLSKEYNMNGLFKLLGKIHFSSLGFQPSMANVQFGVSRWELEYEQVLHELDKWKIENRKSDCEKKKILMESMDFFFKAGRAVKRRLDSLPSYIQWKSKHLTKQFLCHRDFHIGNLLYRKPDIYVIDWEFVKYDLPSRDIDYLITNMFDHDKRWDPKQFKTVFNQYLKENPLTPEQQKLIFMGLSFPHEFHRFLKRKYYLRMTVPEIQGFTHTQRCKIEWMQEERNL
ncbi:MAG TPA: CotS family spore coat protein [Bacillota bacterium]|nr:CotS family spore coat protein [Bacillota bacterium]